MHAHPRRLGRGITGARSPSLRLATARRHRRAPLRLVADGARASSADRRPTDRERHEAATLLGHAQREGRFGASDLYERRLGAVEAATSRRELDALVADLDALVPETVRAEVIELLCRAHADGRLGVEELDERTSRCFGPLDAAGADALVGDLGHRIVRGDPARTAYPYQAAWWRRGLRPRRVLRSVRAPVGVGAGVCAVVLAVPATLSVPGGEGQWVSLAVSCGLFSAVATVISACAWKLRARRPGAQLPWQPKVQGRDLGAPQPDAPTSRVRSAWSGLAPGGLEPCCGSSSPGRCAPRGVIGGELPGDAG